MRDEGGGRREEGVGRREEGGGRREEGGGRREEGKWRRSRGREEKTEIGMKRSGLFTIIAPPHNRSLPHPTQNKCSEILEHYYSELYFR